MKVPYDFHAFASCGQFSVLILRIIASAIDTLCHTLRLASRTHGLLLLRLVAGFFLLLCPLNLDWPLALLILTGLVEEELRIEMRRKDKGVRRSTMRIILWNQGKSVLRKWSVVKSEE